MASSISDKGIGFIEYFSYCIFSRTLFSTKMTSSSFYIYFYSFSLSLEIVRTDILIIPDGLIVHHCPPIWPAVYICFKYFILYSWSKSYEQAGV